jgi:hypothetical protein
MHDLVLKERAAGRHIRRLWLWFAAAPLAWFLTTNSPTCPAAVGQIIVVSLACALLAYWSCAIRKRSGGRTFRIAVTIFAISLLPVWNQITREGIPFSHDLGGHLWALWGTARSWMSGDIWPIWHDRVGLGQPILQFYPPLTHLLGAGLLIAGFEPIVVAKLLAWLSGLVGALLLWLVLVDLRVSRFGILIGACAFLLAPYRLLDVNYRFALGEMFGLCWTIPFIHLLLQVGLHKHGPIFRKPARWLWACALLLTLTHPQSFVMALTVGVPILLTANWLNTGSVIPRCIPLLRLAVILLFAIGACAFYVIPASLEADQARIGAVVPNNRFAYVAKSLRLSQPLTREHWNGRRLSWTLLQERKRQAEGKPILEVPFYAGWGLVMAILLAGAEIRRRHDRRERESGNTTNERSDDCCGTVLAPAYAVGASIGLLATTSMLARPMGVLPIYYLLQFPWRFLGPASMAAVMALALWSDRRLCQWQRATSSTLPVFTVFIGILAMLIYDAYPALGAGDWLSVSGKGDIEPHVRNQPSAVCRKGDRNFGYAGFPVELEQYSSDELTREPLPDIPRFQTTPETEQRFARLDSQLHQLEAPIREGPDWVGLPYGDLPLRVFGASLPPGELDSPFALVHYAFPEYFTPTTARVFRSGARLGHGKALAAMGTRIYFRELGEPLVDAIEPWAMVQLLSAVDGKRYAVRARVTRQSPRRIHIALPLGVPPGRLIFTEQQYLGWESEGADGYWQPAESWHGLLSTSVSSGQRHVRFRYGIAAPHRYVGISISLVCVASMIFVSRRWNW